MQLHFLNTDWLLVFVLKGAKFNHFLLLISTNVCRIFYSILLSQLQYCFYFSTKNNFSTYIRKKKKGEKFGRKITLFSMCIGKVINRVIEYICKFSSRAKYTWEEYFFQYFFSAVGRKNYYTVYFTELEKCGSVN